MKQKGCHLVREREGEKKREIHKLRKRERERVREREREIHKERSVALGWFNGEQVRLAKLYE